MLTANLTSVEPKLTLEYAAFEFRVHIYLIQVEITAGMKHLCKESNKFCTWPNTTNLSMS